VLVLQETFTVPMAIGFLLVITGSVLATRPARTQELDPTPAPA
jgi:drug/metabolite transporter (DMT)-like permease